MTQTKQFTLHIISVVLMVGTLQLGFWMLGEPTMMTVLAVIGSLAFGFCWKRATDYLTDKND